MKKLHFNKSGAVPSTLTPFFSYKTRSGSGNPLRVTPDRLFVRGVKLHCGIALWTKFNPVSSATSKWRIIAIKESIVLRNPAP